MTIDELVKESVAGVKTADVKPEDQVILDEIEAVLHAIKGEGTGVNGVAFKDRNRDELSRMAGSLALLKDNLGDILAKFQAFRDATKQYIVYRRARLRDRAISELNDQEEKKKAQNKPFKKVTVDDIESFLEVQVYGATQIYLVRERQYNEVLNKWRSINSILDVISQRINVISSNMADVKHYDDGLDFGALKNKQDKKEGI